MMTHLHRFSHSADVKQFTNTIIQLVRFACWCFALVAFMFVLPKAGIIRFDLSVYASLETIVQSIPNLMFSSWALAIVALEAWVAREGGMRLIIFSTIALVAVLVTAYGLNIIYINYLHPAGLSRLMPYAMVINGLMGWLLILSGRQVLLRRKG